MKYVGIDLHMNQARQILERHRLICCDPAGIRGCFARLGPCRVVVEATASCEWLLRLIEPLVEQAVLAHPRKLRIMPR